VMDLLPSSGKRKRIFLVSLDVGNPYPFSGDIG
jgi:hypothetical protein